MQHRWYLVNLPPYLKKLSSQSLKSEQNVDMEIVD